MRFLHTLDAVDLLALNRKVADAGGVALAGMHLFYFGKTPAARSARAVQICDEAAAHPSYPVQLDPIAMAAQMERYHAGLIRVLDMDVPVGLMMQGLDSARPLGEAEEHLRETYDHLLSLDTSGRDWIVVPTHATSAQPLYQDWDGFLRCVYGGLGIRLPVLCGCSLLTYSDGEVVEPREDVYACINALALTLHDSELFDEVKWHPDATYNRALPFNNPFR
jgi:hypothetical protein